MSRLDSIKNRSSILAGDLSVAASNKLEEIQNATYKDMIRLVDKHGIVNVARPTGFGKTHILMRYVKEYGLNCLYLYDKDVNRQRVISNYGLDRSNTYSYAKMFRDDKDVFVDYLKTNKIQVVLFDESHTVGAKTIDMKWVDIIEACHRSGIKVIGGTATEIRSSGVDVTKEYFHGIEVFKYDVEDAVSDEIIKLPLYVCTAIDNDGISSIKQYLSESEYNILIDANNIDELIDYSLKECGIRNSDYFKIIVFCKDIADINEVRIEQYKEVCKSLFSGMESNVIPVTSHIEHKDNIAEVTNYNRRPNAVDIFLAVDMMNQGFHFDDLSGIIMESGTRSNIVYTQQVGRCMSVINKNDMFVLDRVNNMDSEFYCANKVAKLFREQFAKSGKENNGCRETDRERVRMSPKQREAAEIVAKIKNQRQIIEAKNLAAVVKFYRRFPDKNVILAGEAAGMNQYATLEYLDSIGVLRDEDKLTEFDMHLGITKSFRLVTKYKQTHNF